MVKREKNTFTGTYKKKKRKEQDKLEEKKQQLQYR